MKWFYCLLGIALASSVFSFGAYYGQRVHEPEVVTQIQYVERPVYIEQASPEVGSQIHNIPLPPVERVVEKIIQKSSPLTDFQSLDELTQFLKENGSSKGYDFVANSRGLIVFNGQCANLAEQLQARAEAKGKRLDKAIIDSDQYYRWYGERIPIEDSHAVNMAWIGKEIYFIEPQTDRVWLVSYRGDK